MPLHFIQLFVVAGECDEWLSQKLNPESWATQHAAASASPEQGDGGGPGLFQVGYMGIPTLSSENLQEVM